MVFMENVQMIQGNHSNNDSRMQENFYTIDIKNYTNFEKWILL
jgi:hypothetical protein